MVVLLKMNSKTDFEYSLASFCKEIERALNIFLNRSTGGLKFQHNILVNPYIRLKIVFSFYCVCT